MVPLQGTEQIGGRPVWVIGAQPKSGYKPKLKRAELLTSLVTTLFVPLTAGAGDTTLQGFVFRLVLASSVKPVKLVGQDSTTFVFDLR